MDSVDPEAFAEVQKKLSDLAASHVKTRGQIAFLARQHGLQAAHELLLQVQEGCERDVMAVIKRCEGLQHLTKEGFLDGVKNTRLSRNRGVHRNFPEKVMRDVQSFLQNDLLHSLEDYPFEAAIIQNAEFF
ncbi:hypothetical protein ABBQ38_009862 [Trebouxia sp. C0009 RCD-2024]